MAQCVDLRRERIRPADRFLLDTNVIVKASSLYGSERDRPYLTFVSDALRAGATLAVSLLSLLELAHVVERLRFRQRGGVRDDAAGLKTFRADPAERARVVRDVTSTWDEIGAFAEVLPVELGGDFAARFVAALGATTLDAYDVAFVEAARRAKISTIVSDDRDFKSASGIIVFTANPRALD